MFVPVAEEERCRSPPLPFEIWSLVGSNTLHFEVKKLSYSVPIFTPFDSTRAVFALCVGGERSNTSISVRIRHAGS